MGIDEIIEYLRTLPEDAIVKVSVMDRASMARNSIVIDGVVDGGVWCREDIGTLIEDNGRNPTPENIDKVLAAVPGGLGSFSDRLTQEGWDILHDIYDGAIDALR